MVAKIPKVTAALDPKQTTIENATGAVTETRTGVLKGFGEGFRDYVLKGPKKAMVAVEGLTGAYPEGHAHAGKWAVQINVGPFLDEEDAAAVCDRVVAMVRAGLTAPLPTPPPTGKIN